MSAPGEHATAGAPAAGPAPAPVSAVVVNYQGADYLPRCLGALAALDPAPAEVIVVDNASDDGSDREAEGRADVRVVRMGRNAGPAAARNAGLRAARHERVLLLDNDVVCDPDVLGELGRTLDRHPDAALLEPRGVFAAEPERVHYDGGFVHYAGLVSLRNWYRPLEEARRADPPEGAPVDVDCVISLCLLVRRSVVLGLGGFDERMFILFEDLDLSYRARLAGHRLLSVPTARVLHDAGTPGVSFREGTRYPTRRVFFHSRNRWLFLLRNYHLRTLLVAAPGLLLYEAAWLAFSARHGGLGSWLAGKGACLRLLPDTLRLRRATQRARAFSDRKLLRGGPLTLTPDVARGGAARGAAGLLDRGLALWWGLVRRLAG